MIVTFFARVDIALNPYLLLYKRELERQGILVRLEREFSLNWMLTRGKSCDAIHLHWIEAAYKPSGGNARSRLAEKLVTNRFSRTVRGVLRLANFSAALLLAKWQGICIVYTVHNLTYSGQFRPFVILHRLANRVVFSIADRIHAHNHYTRRILENVYGRRDGVVVVPLGNYVGHYPNEVSRLEARRQLGLPADAFVYLFLGLVRPYKGVEELIDAFGKLGSPTDRLLVVGRVLTSSYEEEILRLGQNNSAIRLVLEFVPDEAIQLYMNACDICVLPYRNITTSSAAVLALSFGRPAIAPATTSFPELVTPGNGILYDPSQPDALVSAMQQARERSWSRSEILDRVHRFDWEVLGPQLANLYIERPSPR
jgi:beta-1,4-mannosyltransferase